MVLPASDVTGILGVKEDFSSSHLPINFNDLKVQ